MHKLSFTLLLVGGLNWGILALTGWDIGQLLGGMDSTASKIVYVAVGLAAVYEILGHKKICKECEKMRGGKMGM